MIEHLRLSHGEDVLRLRIDEQTKAMIIVDEHRFGEIKIGLLVTAALTIEEALSLRNMLDKAISIAQRRQTDES